MSPFGAATGARLRMSSSGGHIPEPSERISKTDDPCIVSMQRMMAGKVGIMSLAQGIVHWKPPPSALQDMQKACLDPDSHS